MHPTRGSLVGRVGRARVARGSLISTPVREIRGSRGDPPLNIYYYYSAEGRSATRDPSKKNIVLGVYRGKGASRRWQRRKNFRAARVEFRGCLLLLKRRSEKQWRRRTPANITRRQQQTKTNDDYKRRAGDGSMSD